MTCWKKKDKTFSIFNVYATWHGTHHTTNSRLKKNPKITYSQNRWVPTSTPKQGARLCRFSLRLLQGSTDRGLEKPTRTAQARSKVPHRPSPASSCRRHRGSPPAPGPSPPGHGCPHRRHPEGSAATARNPPAAGRGKDSAAREATARPGQAQPQGRSGRGRRWGVSPLSGCRPTHQFPEPTMQTLRGAAESAMAAPPAPCQWPRQRAPWGGRLTLSRLHRQGIALTSLRPCGLPGSVVPRRVARCLTLAGSVEASRAPAMEGVCSPSMAGALDQKWQCCWHCAISLLSLFSARLIPHISVIYVTTKLFCSLLGLEQRWILLSPQPLASIMLFSFPHASPGENKCRWAVGLVRWF